MTSNLIDRLRVEASDLLAEFPSTFDHPNKSLVYSIASPPGSDHRGTVNYSRWRAMPLPADVDLSTIEKTIEIQENFYDYTPIVTPQSGMEWHVNFADPVLFAAFNSGLFAQDEMQVAEHPALGSLADYLSAHGHKRLTVEHREPTPVLVSGVERRCSIATDRNAQEHRPNGLYGYLFSEASSKAVEHATRVIDPPTITNLIAMAGPHSGRGKYSIQDVAYILSTAFTAFHAAVEETASEVGPGAQAVVHTGFWGCGAFGGNRYVMSALQIVSARMAGVDTIVFHTADAAGAETVRESMDLIESKLMDAADGSMTSTGELIKKVLGLGFMWGESDGN